MKEKIMNNFALKVLAVVVALLVWIVVVNLEDPIATKNFRNITVEILNEEAIVSLDKVYEVQSGGVINVKASARQSVLSKLTATDIVAEADLSSLSLTNAVAIKLSCPKYENVTLQPDVEMLKITLEDEATAQFKVDVNTVGTLPEGFALGDVIVRPNLIKVSGAQSLIDRISEVRVEVDVSDMTEDFKRRVEPKAYDANGKLMDNTRLTFSSSEVRVSVGINETKDVPVNITTRGEPDRGYHLISVEYEPKQLKITGREEILSKITQIPIVLDISGRNTDLETELLLADYLPSGVSVVGEATSVNVKLTISKQEPQKVQIPLSNIEVRNLGKNMELEYDMSSAYVEISAIKFINIENRTIQATDFRPYIDCSDLKEGEYRLELKFEPSNDIQVLSEITIKVKIKEKVEEKLPVTEEPEETSVPEETLEVIEPTSTAQEEPEETREPEEQ